MTSTSVTPLQNFEDNIKQRLIKDIGALIPDEALQALVEKAIGEVFFKDKVEKGQYYNSADIITPSGFKVVVKELMAERVQAAIEAYIAANEDKVLEVLKAALNESAETVVLRSLSQLFTAPLADFQMKMNHQLIGISQKVGGPY